MNTEAVLSQTRRWIRTGPAKLGGINFLAILHMSVQGAELPFSEEILRQGVFKGEFAELVKRCFVFDATLSNARRFAVLGDPQFQLSKARLFKHPVKTAREESAGKGLRISRELLNDISTSFVDLLQERVFAQEYEPLLSGDTVAMLAMLILRRDSQSVLRDNMIQFLNEQGLQEVYVDWQLPDGVCDRLGKELPGKTLEALIFTREVERF